MNTSARFLGAPLALFVALSAGACKGREGNVPDTTLSRQDTTLTRDMQLANRDTAVQPQLKDVPADTQTPAPTKRTTTASSAPRVTPRPTPRTATPRSEKPTSAPAPVTTASGNTVERTTKGSEGTLATIPAGTTINLSSGARVCSNTNKAGDRFTATVSQAVTGSNGATIPAGAKAVVQVASLQKSNNSTQPIQMTFNVLSVTYNGKTYPLDAEITHVDVEKVRTTSRGSDAKKVVGGAAIGAILGQVIGHNTKSTVIGAATGAAAGTAVAMGTGDYDGCVPTGGKITIKLDSPATIQAE